ncbi:transcriptional regulator [Streptodolium elevatio]
MSAVAAEAAVVALVPGPRKPSGTSSKSKAAARPRKVSPAVAAQRLLAKFAPVSGELPRLWVPESEQTVKATRGRVTQDGYSWMQSAHWTVGSGCYVPVRSHGPRAMNATTLRLGQELAALSPCRPGVEYLARRLKMSERAVEYHLGMLREAGLLVYIEKGTRYRGKGARASEFALVIPPAYDAALGIRTTGEGPSRRATGIAEAGRELVAKLGRKASRKIRAPRATAVEPAAESSAKPQVNAPENTPAAAVADPSGGAVDNSGDSSSRCTPMEGVTAGFSPGLSLVVPLEAQLAGGTHDHAPSTHQKPARRTVNKVGRRFQLAAELVREIGWLAKASVPRVAWVVGEVSDAGWTCAQVAAWLATVDAPTEGARRPSGLLASRLRGVTGLPGWRTAAERAGQVEHWRDSARATRARHADQVWNGGIWQLPVTAELAADVESAFAAIDQARDGVDGVSVHHVDDQVLELEDLSRDQVLELRRLGEQDHDAVLSTIDLMGEDFARRLYTNRLVDWVLHKQRTAAPAPAAW